MALLVEWYNHRIYENIGLRRENSSWAISPIWQVNWHKSFPTDHFIIRNFLGPGVKSLEDVVMDEVDDLKTWLRKKEGEPLALSYKLNIGILNVLWSVTCGRWEISALCHYSTLLCSENFWGLAGFDRLPSASIFSPLVVVILRVQSMKIEFRCFDPYFSYTS